MGLGAPMRMAVVGREAGEYLDPPLLHTPHRSDPIRELLNLIRSPMHHDDLQTEIVSEVHVKSGANAISELVLQLGELLAEVPHVVVVDDRQGRDGVDALLHLRPPDLSTREVSKQL